jgi:transposase-like protein
MGFQAALGEVWPKTKIQRCWFHKSGNVLDKLPSSLQGKAKDMLHDQYLAPTKEEALKAFSFQNSRKNLYATIDKVINSNKIP